MFKPLKSRFGQSGSRRYLAFTISLWLSMVGLSACGVKGDPLPPESAPYIGSGEPNFKGGISEESIEEEPIEEELIEEEYEEY